MQFRSHGLWGRRTTAGAGAAGEEAGRGWAPTGTGVSLQVTKRPGRRRRGWLHGRGNVPYATDLYT